MKKLILAVIALAMLLSALAPLAQAQEINYGQKIAEQFEGFWSRRPPAPTPEGVGSQQERAVFLKTQGCAKALFTVPAVPKAYRAGIFAVPMAKQAWVRISSDTIPRTPDHGKSTIGLAVKVLGIEGEKVLPGEMDQNTQDFLVQNHDVFFVDTAKDFFEFNEAVFAGKFNDYVAAHPDTKRILDAMDKVVENVLSIDYWSTVPSHFGSTHAKYKVSPCQRLTTEPVPPPSEANYLQPRLERQLKEQGACFKLQVQLRQDGMPLDKATEPWLEGVSVPQTVATILIYPQDIKLNAQACERMSFNPWHSLKEHKPAGSIQEARGIVYKHMADKRRRNIQAPIGEPQPE